jgi:regulatory protein
MFKQKSKTKEPENKEKAYEYAVFLLSLQLRTEGEIREKMAGRGYGPSVINTTLGTLKAQKYIDDERYAEVFLENLKQYKNYGYYGIKKKFLLKKLPSEIIDRVLDESFSPADELLIAKRFLKKEKISLKENEDDASDVTYSVFNAEESKEKQKIAQKLKAKGFRSDVISKLVF